MILSLRKTQMQGAINIRVFCLLMSIFVRHDEKKKRARLPPEIKNIPHTQRDVLEAITRCSVRVLNERSPTMFSRLENV